MKTKGKHYLLDLWTQDDNMLDTIAYLRKLLLDAAHESGSTVLSVCDFKFEPQGVSIAVLIAESHLSVHTYPEHNYAAFDIYTCGKTNIDKAVGFIIKSMDPIKWNILQVDRGTLELFEPKVFYLESTDEGNSNKNIS